MYLVDQYNEQCDALVNCVACGHGELHKILDLGEQPPANSYRDSTEKIDVFPLGLNRCKNCSHIQLTHAVNPDILFKNYLYVSGTSQTLKEYFEWFAPFTEETYRLFSGDDQPKTVLDIGCNDGSQLDVFMGRGFETYGVDPAENLYEATKEKGHDVHCGYFNEKYVRDTKHISFDIITAQNVFAHTANPLAFLKNIKKKMHGYSLLFIQTSQADLIKNNEFDTVYHEHISFFNVRSMFDLVNRAGLNLIDVIKTPIHGNSYVFVIAREYDRRAHLFNAIEMERKAGLYNPETYAAYTKKVHDLRVRLSSVLEKYSETHVIVGYGAAAKGMTLLNSLPVVRMDFIIDDNPLKQGKWTPGVNIPIVAPEHLASLSPDKPILFVPLAWNFYDEIRGKIQKLRSNPIDSILRYFPTVHRESVIPYFNAMVETD